MPKIPTTFSTGAWLATLLRRHFRGSPDSNIRLIDDGTGRDTCSLEDGEQAVAVVRATDGREYLFTDRRLIQADETVFRYEEVLSCHWMTDAPIAPANGRRGLFGGVVMAEPAGVHMSNTFDRPVPAEDIAKFKRAHYDRLILRLCDGRRVVLEHLGQAVFPLLRFLQGLTG